jgi:hypothetical protein
MARALQNNYSNIDAGGRLEQSYDGNSPLYGRGTLPGRPRNIQDATTRDCLNASDMVKQVSVITIGAFAAGFYNVRLEIGTDNLVVNVAVEALAADTVAALQVKLLDALRASRAGSRLRFESAAATITATANNAGTNGGFNVILSGGGAGYVAAETVAPSNPKSLIPGRLLVAMPGEQEMADENNPNGVGGIVSVRYPRTAAELEFIAGILIRTEFNGPDFFGAPSQDPVLAPSMVGTLFERGDIAIEAIDTITAGTTFHVYLEAAGAKAGLIRSTADPIPGMTAQLPTTAFLKMRTYNPIAGGQAGYISIK